MMHDTIISTAYLTIFEQVGCRAFLIKDMNTVVSLQLNFYNVSIYEDQKTTQMGDGGKMS